MGGLSVWHWLIFLVVALLLFGGSGKISSIMGDVAKGIKSFKKGMTDDDEVKPAPGEDPFKKDEPRALENSGHTQAGHTQSGPAQTGQTTPQANKVG